MLATDFGRTGRTWFIPRALHLCQRTEYGFICALPGVGQAKMGGQGSWLDSIIVHRP